MTLNISGITQANDNRRKGKGGKYQPYVRVSGSWNIGAKKSTQSFLKQQNTERAIHSSGLQGSDGSEAVPVPPPTPGKELSAGSEACWGSWG